MKKLPSRIEVKSKNNHIGLLINKLNQILDYLEGQQPGGGGGRFGEIKTIFEKDEEKVFGFTPSVITLPKPEIGDMIDMEKQLIMIGYRQALRDASKALGVEIKLED